MSLPTNVILPFRPEQIRSGGDGLVKYQRDLVNHLTEQYRELVQNINGRFTQFTPQLKGESSSGAATYSTQSGLYLRQGLLTQVWFHIVWSGHTGTGSSYIDLPYQVSNQTGTPFPGVLESSGITYTGFDTLTLNASPSTFKAYVWKNGTAATRTKLAIPASGTLIGYISFWGREDET